MKKLFRISMLLCTVMFFAVSCGKDLIQVAQPEPDQENGYLVLAGMNVGVSTDIETVESKPQNMTRVTRVPVDAEDSYKVEILNSANEAAWTGTYAQIKAMTTPLELKPGRYTITAKSADQILPTAWEQPAYAGQTTFSIVSKLETTVTNLVCTLANIKTSVTLSADLKALFLTNGTDDLKTTVSIAPTESTPTPESVIFLKDEVRAMFFKPLAATNTMTIVLTGKYNVKGEGETPDYQPVTMTQTIPNVKAGQWRKINISIEHAEEGNVQFVITVETWVYDEKITVDVMSTGYTFGEEEVPDVDKEISAPNSPVLMLDGNHDIALPFNITSSIFDMDLHTCTDFISLIATPEGTSTIADAYCVVSSDNATFTAALATAGYTAGKITLFPTNGGTNHLVVRTDEKHRLLIKVNNDGMFGLYNYEGTHTVKIVTTDSQRRKSYTKMTIVVSKAAATGPSIVGLHGYNVKKRYNISATDSPKLKVALEVSSATGVTGCKVYILGGTVLPDNELVGLNLASVMDLVHPATTAMETQLKNLGFLPKDGTGVAGKNKLTFDISEFVPAMTGLGGSGNCDFKIEVTDASGTTTETIMLTVVK